MPRNVDGSLGTMLQGVSQQPDRERIAGQVSEQINMTSDIVRMLHRRPPALFVDRVDFANIDVTKTFVHYYSRGDGEQYFIIKAPGEDLIVVDLDGQEQTVTTSSAFNSYLTSTDPKTDLRMATVGDATYVVNTTKTVAMAAGLSATSSFEGMRVSVEAGQYGRNYEIRVTVGNTVHTAVHTTPQSTETDAEENIATDIIAEELTTLLNAIGGVTAEFTVRQAGSWISLEQTGSATVSIQTFDGTGGGAMRSTYDNEVTTLSLLPPRAKDGEIYKIVGGQGNADDLYMIFNASLTDNSTTSYFQEGTWVETIAPGIEQSLDAGTCPHILFSNTPGTFAGGKAGETVAGFPIAAWANRLVGDTDSNPNPPFVGSTIADVISFQNRLVFLSSEDVTLSVTNDFENFFKKTVSTLLADGPIGIRSSSGQVNILRYAEQHDQDLIIFADRVQFTLFGENAITPLNATMVETTKFQIQTGSLPAPAGQNLFFAIDAGAFSGVREFYTDSAFDSNNARPVTVAVERYIKGKVRQLSSATNISKLAVLAESTNTIYVYEYLWDEGDKIQNSWGTWVFRDDMEIFHVTFVSDRMYVLGMVGSDLHVLNIRQHADAAGDDLTDPFTLDTGIHLDHRSTETGINTTISNMDYLPNDIDLIDAIQGDGSPNPGLRAEIESFDGSTITLKRDMQGGEVIVGLNYLSRVKPTVAFVRDEAGRPISTSKLKIGKYFLNYGSSGDFNVDVTAPYSYTKRNPGRVLGEESATIGEFKLTTGQFSVPIRAENIRSDISIYSDSPYPFTIEDIEWDGQFYQRGKRIARQSGGS